MMKIENSDSVQSHSAHVLVYKLRRCVCIIIVISRYDVWQTRPDTPHSPHPSLNPPLASCTRRYSTNVQSRYWSWS